jgi:uncharacterized protein (TIGR03067 family)
MLFFMAPVASEKWDVLQICVESTPGSTKSKVWRMPGAAGKTESISLDPPVLDARVVASADVAKGPDGSSEIRLALTQEGSEALFALTKMLPGRRLGIIIDGRLRSAPLIREPSRLRVLTVSGGFTEPEAAQLARNLGTPQAGQPVTGPQSAGTLDKPTELEGSWTVRSTTMNGKLQGDDELEEATFAFRGSELTISGRNGKKERFTIRVEAGNLLTIRLDPVSQQGHGGWMIASREGNRLTLAFADNLEGHPEDFSPARKKLVVKLVREGTPSRSACDILAAAKVERALPGATRREDRRRGGLACTFADKAGQQIHLAVVEGAGRTAFEKEVEEMRKLGRIVRPEPDLGPSAVSITRGSEVIFLTLEGETLIALSAQTPGTVLLRDLARRVLTEMRHP